jgi:hypothetical protein
MVVCTVSMRVMATILGAVGRARSGGTKRYRREPRRSCVADVVFVEEGRHGGEGSSMNVAGGSRAA